MIKFVFPLFTVAVALAYQYFEQRLMNSNQANIIKKHEQKKDFTKFLKVFIKTPNLDISHIFEISRSRASKLHLTCSYFKFESFAGSLQSLC